MSNNIFEFSMSNDLTLEFLGRANYKTRFCFNKEVIRIHRNRYALFRRSEIITRSLLSSRVSKEHLLARTRCTPSRLRYNCWTITRKQIRYEFFVDR